MSHVSQRANRLVVAALVAAGMWTAACDDNHDTPTKPHQVSFVGLPLVATVPFTTAIFPQQLGFTPIFGLGCGTFPALTTRFDLVIVSGGRDLFMDEVTLNLLDGTHRGTSPLLVSARDLNARFGSTLIGAGSRRIFTFDPQFGCGRFAPLSLEAQIILLERSGFRHAHTVAVPIG